MSLHRNYVQEHVYEEMLDITQQIDRHFDRTDIRYLSAIYQFFHLPISFTRMVLRLMSFMDRSQQSYE